MSIIIITSITINIGYESYKFKVELCSENYN